MDVRVANSYEYLSVNKMDNQSEATRKCKELGSYGYVVFLDLKIKLKEINTLDLLVTHFARALASDLLMLLSLYLIRNSSDKLRASFTHKKYILYGYHIG